MADLIFEPALSRPELLSASIFEALNKWECSIPVTEILVAEINPDYADGKAFCDHYGVAFSEGANCVIIEAIRGANQTLAACLVPVGMKINLNNVVRKQLNARRISLAPLDAVLAKTQMEYGSITAVGLPIDWPILIDQRLISLPRVVVGAGLKKSKLALHGNALAELPNVIVVDGLSTPI